MEIEYLMLGNDVRYVQIELFCDLGNEFSEATAMSLIS